MPWQSLTPTNQLSETRGVAIAPPLFEVNQAILAWSVYNASHTPTPLHPDNTIGLISLLFIVITYSIHFSRYLNTIRRTLFYARKCIKVLSSKVNICGLIFYDAQRQDMSATSTLVVESQAFNDIILQDLIFHFPGGGWQESRHGGLRLGGQVRHVGRRRGRDYGCGNGVKEETEIPAEDGSNRQVTNDAGVLL